MIEFTIPGDPRGKARPRVVRLKNGASMSYTPDKTVAYEELKIIRTHLEKLTGEKLKAGKRFDF